MILVAVTGGIGAGKTTVLSSFSQLGAAIADADDIAHDLYLPGRPAYQALRERWGEEILNQDGSICRATVAAKVFSQPQELAWLNNLIHPLVQQEIVDMASTSGKPLFCAIPLLHECAWQQQMTATVAVWCDAATQHQRLLARGWSEEEIAGRLSKQLSMDEKMRRADYMVLTGCPRELTHRQCEAVYGTILAGHADDDARFSIHL